MLICYDEVKSCQTAYEVLKMFRKSSLHLVYPNLYLLYRLMATIPVTTASCEHSFSKLSLIKTKLRSTMSQERLEGLMILSVESDITDHVTFEEAIKTFATMAPRCSDFGHTYMPAKN